MLLRLAEPFRLPALARRRRPRGRSWPGATLVRLPGPPPMRLRIRCHFLVARCDRECRQYKSPAAHWQRPRRTQGPRRYCRARLARYQRPRRRRSPTLELQHRLPRHLALPRAHHHRPQPRDRPRNALHHRRRARCEPPSRPHRPHPLYSLRHPLPPSQSRRAPLLRLRRLRPLVLPRKALSVTSNRLARHRRALSLGPQSIGAFQGMATGSREAGNRSLIARIAAITLRGTPSPGTPSWRRPPPRRARGQRCAVTSLGSMDVIRAIARRVRDFPNPMTDVPQLRWKPLQIFSRPTCSSPNLSWRRSRRVAERRLPSSPRLRRRRGFAALATPS
jgi:hypothetical protein